MKNCLYCKHFYLYAGSPGYSEWTPGSTGSIECLKGLWKMDDCDDTDGYRRKMETAQTCDKFEDYKS